MAGAFVGAVACSGAATPALPISLNASAAAMTAPAEEFTPASIAVARTELAREIATTRGELSKLEENGAEDSARWLTQETALLERIDAVLAEQQGTAQHAIDLAKEAVEVAERTRNRRPPAATFQPPHGMTSLDQLYAERDYLEQAESRLKRDIDNAETALEEARDALEEKGRTRRAARERPQTAGDATSAQHNVRLAELESRLAEQSVLLRTKALQALKLQQSLIQPKQRLLAPRFEWLRANLTIGDKELTELQAVQEKRTTELEEETKLARKVSEIAAGRVVGVERRGGGESDAAELETTRANRRTANLTLSVLTAQRERLVEERALAEARHRVLAGGMSAKALRALAHENQSAIDQLTRERRREGRELARVRKELQDGQSQLARAAAAEEKGTTWAVERVKRLAAWIDLSEANIVELDRIRTARNRLKEEIGGQVNLFSWRDGTARVRETAEAAWNYEVFSVKDEPVRVKTILAALLLVMLGHRASRASSAWLSRTLFKRMGMNTGRSAAWQTLWFYGLFIGVLVVASNLFHISLTQFSVVSGALAVGIGFGSQNLISNFISGIILLIERPVNQGDVIEIDGRQVTVERLGPRSTMVRTIDNTHMVVPNSLLLEQPVINWTLSDDVVRRRIAIGVAYDSPTRRVEELLRGVLATVKSVRKEPAPLVKFADFGENSLLFEIYFWGSISEMVDVENELRHCIAEVFAREKVVMAFPQRDVHLETTKPLQVVVTQATSPAAASSRVTPHSSATADTA